MATTPLDPTNRGAGAPDYEDEVDDVVADVAAEDPDYFIAFVRGFLLTDPGAADYVADGLDAGFRRVGQLFVHAYGPTSDFPDSVVSVNLRDICVVAADRGKPVTVHWNIGMVDDAVGGFDAAQNYTQLTPLLTILEQEAPHFTLILADCGVGPYSYNGDKVVEADMADWVVRMTDLLDNHPNV